MLAPTVLLLFSLAVNTSGAERRAEVCLRIAAMLRGGLGNSAGQEGRQTVLESLERHAHGRLSLAPWQDRGDRWATSVRATDMQTTASGEPRTAALGAGRLVAVMTVEGTMSCMYVTLFRSIGRRLVEIVQPYLTRIMSCQRWGDSIVLGRLDGQSFVAKEADGDTEIELAPWNGHEWEPECSLLLTYRPELSLEGEFCRGADCKEAEAAAKRVARQMQREETGPSANHKRVDAELDHLIDLANGSVGMDRIPAAAGWFGPSYTSEFLTPSVVTLDHRPTLALVGDWKAGPAVDSEPIGYAVALWQEDGEKLAAVAGFHLRIAHSTIASVSVTN